MIIGETWDIFWIHRYVCAHTYTEKRGFGDERARGKERSTLLHTVEIIPLNYDHTERIFSIIYWKVV